MNKCNTCGWAGKDEFLRPGSTCGSCGASDVHPMEVPTYTAAALVEIRECSEKIQVDLEKVPGLVILPEHVEVDMRILLKKLTSHP